MCLHRLLPPEYVECWQLFVSACRILCQPALTQNDLDTADTALLKFCQGIELLFGNKIVTPNMHMCCHLKECILDYGPLNHFWLFAFERFNGILGQLPSNNRSVEVQMMKHFLSHCDVMRVQVPEEFKEEFSKYTVFGKDLVGTLLADAELSKEEARDETNISLPKYYTRSVFDSSEIDDIVSLLKKLCPMSAFIDVNTTHKRYSTAVVNGKTYGIVPSVLVLFLLSLRGSFVLRE